MTRRGTTLRGLIAPLLAIWAVFVGAAAWSAEDPAATEKRTESLTARQEALALRYQRFENTLLQLAEYLRKTDPERAELLVRRLGKSKETRIPDQFQQLIQLLGQDQLGDAIDGQQQLLSHLQLLLQLLQSEDRQNELERERQRLMGLIKDVDRLITKQTDVRNQTEQGRAGDKLTEQQQQIADAAKKLSSKIDKQDADRNGDKDPKPDDKTPASDTEKEPGKEGEKQDGDKPASDKGKDGEQKSSKKPGEQTPKDTEKPKTDKPSKDSKSGGDSQSKPEEKPADSGKESSPQKSQKSPQKSQSPPKSSQPQDPSESPPEQPPSDDMPPGSESPQQQPEESPPRNLKELQKTPGRDQLEAARERMERAIEELRQKQTEKASDEQDKALTDLLKAKEQLEQILRQLREEEKELVLAALEARFRDILARQLSVYNGTVGLHAIPEEQRADRHRNRAIELARNEDEVVLLTAKVLTLLKEEGSSIAFPEAVDQLQGDMHSVARRLERVDVGEITQTIERDIIEALEEILDSLQKELEKAKDQQRQQQQQQEAQQQDPALVDKLSELKMLRSLQYRINRRTQQMSRLVDGDQANDADVLQQLRQLSVRQARIQQTAYDLSKGRNK